MQITKKGFIGIIASVALVLQGCLITPATVVKKESFDGKKRYALLTVMAPDTIIKKGQPNNTSLAGLIKSASAESGYSADSDKIFAKTYPIAIKQLDKSPHFKLLSGNKLHRNKAYKRIKGESPPSFLGYSFNVAKGYKFLSDEKKYASAIKSLGVDGAISLSISYMFGTSGFNLGFIEAGKQRAIVMITVSGINPEGKLIWRDTVEQVSEDYIGVIAGSANFKELEPLLKEAVTSGMKKVMDNFEVQIITASNHG